MSRRLALLSVSDKTDIEKLGSGLVKAGYTLLSTGGTARALRAAGLPVVPVNELTGHPEIMNGRVKTLHPKIHGGILGLRDTHADEAAAHGVEWIDVVAVNLYPFESTVSRPGVTLPEAVEQIDIGGPSMVRSAAKNHRYVTVLTSPADYDSVLAEIEGGGVSDETRQSLAVRAFQHTAAYDALISTWLSSRLEVAEAPAEAAIPLRQVQSLRYGENPHQAAVFYASPGEGGRSLARATQLQGKKLSFNNLADLDGCLRAVFEFDEPACVVVKHMNPCGAAVHADGPTAAFTLALSADPVSAYGGIVAFNRPVDVDTVRALRKSRTFFEVLAAPGFSDEARALLAPRERLRVMLLPEDWMTTRPAGMDARRVQGGWLLQDWDVGASYEWNIASQGAPDDDTAAALQFAWRVCRSVKSNAIVLARAVDGGFVLNGVGAGQMSRVDSVRLAISKATREVPGSVLASDAFFPFPDGVEIAVAAGVQAFVQPGGSIRDEAILAAVDGAGASMVFTGARHFRH
ncbi:MAG: bifunctional phosphoribosylaminoimidazolecarboxamide formyltransferase/IMP cyclohydrolase [Myxococcota bacterium]|nr:bifunctional phosphoribosylaminoimidazolecarboxamide formyltransferase/IMP cyclohydrolase [Myxococcota bacterium]